MNEKKLDVNTIPDTLARVLDEGELATFIQESLIEEGQIISTEDAKAVSEIAFDYVVYKLTETRDLHDKSN